MTLDDLIRGATALREQYSGDTQIAVCVLGEQGYTTRDICLVAPALIIETPNEGRFEVLGIAVVAPTNG